MFVTAFAAGQALSLEEAVAEALEESEWMVRGVYQGIPSSPFSP
jgi:hypothetical protein